MTVSVKEMSKKKIEKEFGWKYPEKWRIPNIRCDFLHEYFSETCW
jgi:hypothetical protein